MQVECSERNLPSLGADQKLVATPDHSYRSRPRELQVAVPSRLRQLRIVPGAVADKWHGQVVKGCADHFAQALLVRRPELDKTVLREKIKQLGVRSFSRQNHSFRVSVPAINPAFKDLLEQALLRCGQSLRAAEHAPQRQSPRLAGLLQESGQLQRRRGAGMKQVRLEPYQ